MARQTLEPGTFGGTQSVGQRTHGQPAPNRQAPRIRHWTARGGIERWRDRARAVVRDLSQQNSGGCTRKPMTVAGPSKAAVYWGTTESIAPVEAGLGGGAAGGVGERSGSVFPCLVDMRDDQASSFTAVAGKYAGQHAFVIVDALMGQDRAGRQWH